MHFVFIFIQICITFELSVISPGSAATYLRWGEMYYMTRVENFFFSNSERIWQIGYGLAKLEAKCDRLSLLDHCYSPSVGWVSASKYRFHPLIG